MGTFLYDRGETPIVLDDRTLAHLQSAMSVKLRRKETFMFTVEARHMPSGRGSWSCWITGAVPLRFEYLQSFERRSLNAAWVEALVAEASGGGGLRIMPEPDPHPGPRDGPVR